MPLFSLQSGLFRASAARITRKHLVNLFKGASGVSVRRKAQASLVAKFTQQENTPQRGRPVLCGPSIGANRAQVARGRQVIRPVRSTPQELAATPVQPYECVENGTISFTVVSVDVAFMS